MFLNYFALLTAIALSIVAAYYSIYGLTALFPGDFTAIVAMGIVLEVAKVLTATWLHRNWNITSRLIRVYLVCGCFVLMLITSIGIFGFLSKSHIESSLKSTGVDFQELTTIKGDYDAQKYKIDDIKSQIAQVDGAIAKLSGNRAIEEITKQKKSRETLTSKLLIEQKILSNMETRRSSLEAATKKIEAEVGPLKYVANQIYGSADATQLEAAVRAMIMMIIFAFDPMAIFLIMAVSANIEKTNRIKTSGFLQKAELAKVRGRPPGTKNKPKSERYQMVNKKSIASIDPMKDI